MIRHQGRGMIRLRFCSIEFTAAGAVTRFPDGTSVDATPHPDDPRYHVISHRLGYGSNVLAYCQIHEFAHAYLAERLRDRPSHVLWQLAHGQKVDRGEALYEEMATQQFQRWLHANEEPIVSCANWSKLKADALELLA